MQKVMADSKTTASTGTITLPGDVYVNMVLERDRLLAAINEAYRIMCSGKPPHSAREVNARRVLRLAGAKLKEETHV